MLIIIGQKSYWNKKTYAYPITRRFVLICVYTSAILLILSFIAIFLENHVNLDQFVELIGEDVYTIIQHYANLYVYYMAKKLTFNILFLISIAFYLLENRSFSSLTTFLILFPGNAIYVVNMLAEALNQDINIPIDQIINRIESLIPDVPVLDYSIHVLIYLSWIGMVISSILNRKKKIPSQSTSDKLHPKKTDEMTEGDTEEKNINFDHSYSESTSTVADHVTGDDERKIEFGKVNVFQNQPPNILSPPKQVRNRKTREIKQVEKLDTTSPDELDNKLENPILTKPPSDSFPKFSPITYPKKTFNFNQPKFTPLGKKPAQFTPITNTPPLEKKSNETSNENQPSLQNINVTTPVKLNTIAPPSKKTQNIVEVSQGTDSTIQDNEQSQEYEDAVSRESTSEYLYTKESLDLSSNVEFLQSFLNTPTVIPFGDMTRALTYSSDHIIRLWDIEKDTLIFEQSAHKSTISDIKIYNNNRYFVSSSWDRTLKIWDLETGDLLDTLPTFNYEISYVEVFGEGKRIIIGSNYGHIDIWDNVTSKSIQSFKTDSKISVIRVTDDNKKFFTGCFNNTILLWNIIAGAIEMEYIGHTDRIISIITYKKGEKLISASQDTTIKIWDVKTGVCESTLTGHKDSVQTICLINSDRYLVSGSADGELILWDLEERKSIKNIEAHQGAVITCVYSNNVILTYGMDRLLKLWDCTTFERISEKQFPPENAQSKLKRTNKVDLNILIASNDKESYELAKEILLKLGYINYKIVTTIEDLETTLQNKDKFNILFLDMSLFGTENIEESTLTQLGENTEKDLYVVVLKSNEFWFLDVNDLFDNVPNILDIIHKPITGLAVDKVLREVEDLIKGIYIPKIGSRNNSLGHIDLKKFGNQHTKLKYESSKDLKKRLSATENLFRLFTAHQFFKIISPYDTDKLQLGNATCRTVTVMFSDIRDFSALSENMSVSELMEFINCYYAFAIPPILEQGGFVDKFIGDSIMCLFTQQSGAEQSIAAVNCAVNILKNLDFMKSNGFKGVETGIGINTGRTIIGLVGTETRMEPTVLGDSVNLASRLESLCKVYHSRIIITEYTKEKMGRGADLFTIRELDYVAVKGKRIACRIFEVIDGDQPDIRENKKKIIKDGHWKEALNMYQSGDFIKAQKLFENCLKIYPFDKPSKIYIDRCKSYISESLNEVNMSEWNPIHRLENK